MERRVPTRLRRLRGDRAALGALAILIAASLFVVFPSPGNPPGFHHDEASIAENAYLVSRTLHGERHDFLPLYIQSFNDYKSTEFMYLLAAVFRILPPSNALARGIGSLVVLAAILGIGLLAWRLTRSRAVAVSIVVIAAFTPWLYELARVAFDTNMEPVMIVAVLLAVEWARRAERGVVLRGVVTGAALSALTYSYAGGRSLGPLFAAVLVVFVTRERWRWVVASWAAFLVGLIPLGVYALRHPGALTARYNATKFSTPGMSRVSFVRHAATNYLHDVNLWRWLTSGDQKPYIHTWGAPQLGFALVGLAALGIFAIVRSGISRWWVYVLVLALLSPIPAALTVDRHDALRLLPIPVFVCVLAIPGLAFLWEGVRRGWVFRVALGVAAVVVVAQLVQFEANFQGKARSRWVFFDSDVPSILGAAHIDQNVLYIDQDDIYAQTDARWYAATHGFPQSHVSVLPGGGPPPIRDAWVFGRLQPCRFTCKILYRAEDYWVALGRPENP